MYGQPPYVNQATIMNPGQPIIHPSPPLVGQTTPMPLYGSPPAHAIPAQPIGQPTTFDDKHFVRLQNFIFLGTYGKIRALEVIEGGMFS